MSQHTRRAFRRSRLIAGHRYLTPDGGIYPSVTTILGATKTVDEEGGLAAWRARVGEQVADYVTREAAEIGTEAHQMNEDYLNRVPARPVKRLLARAHHENFRPHLDRITNIHGTEVPLHSDMLCIAGTADCIAEYDGVPSIIDYKTKRAPQQPDWINAYHAQAAAYAIMYRELTGIEIRQGVILVSSERDTMQVFRSDPRDHALEFLKRLTIYDRNSREADDAEWRAKYGHVAR